jgi:hypothetical protein
MKVRCPYCGAIIRFAGAIRGRPWRVTCWMCDSALEQDPSRAGSVPPTAISPDSDRHDRPVNIRLRAGLAETDALDLPPDDLVIISVTSGRSLGEEFQLSNPLTTIGRRGGRADIEIDDPEVSRSHCAIEVRSDRILLHDLRSTNGTYLGYHRVSVVRLEPMSHFRIGSTFLQLKLLKLRGSPMAQQLHSHARS